MAEEGDKVDEKETTRFAAAQLGELMDPMDGQGVHLSEGDAAEDDMVDNPTPPPSCRQQPPPFRGAGWSSNLQSLPDEPTSPSGLGEGGKREREQSAQLTPGESEPKQSRGIMRHLTNRDMYGNIQKCGTAEVGSNPSAIQGVSNVTDFVDQLLDQ